MPCTKLGIVNRFPRWQHHQTKYHKLCCKIGLCKLFHQIVCFRNVLNYTTKSYNENLSLFELDLQEFGIK